tara:strand:- start:4411 stop:5430 length:1020 start_codon:yes stop_codon:yes gene_type:complete
MILKSYEAHKNISNFSKYNFYLLYGENLGLKKDTKEIIKKGLVKQNENVEIQSIYENEFFEKKEYFINTFYSGSLFSNKKIILINGATDKILKIVNEVFDQCPENIFFIIFSEILEKKSKLRNFFEKDKKAVCIPCYADTERDLEIIAQSELGKDKINLSREVINLLVEKSNADRNNLRNEIEKIKCYSVNKKNISLEEIKSLINFSGDYKSDSLVNECLCGNTLQYKKIVSELFENTINQILLFRILSKKIQRLLIIKEQVNKSDNIDYLISNSKPAIFWKEKPIVKKQLSIWNLNDLKKLINEINNIELLCKKNPQVSKVIFFGFFLKICEKASNFS